MHKIVKILLIVLGAIAAILWFMLPESEMPASEAIDSGAMNGMFIIMYILLGIAVVSSLLFALKNLFSNPASLKKTLFVIVGFLLVVAIAYVLSDGADGTVEEMAGRGVTTTESTVKNIGAGLNMFFILVIIAVASMLWGGIKKMSNK
ncbi:MULTISPECIES: hypothetical protein [Robiginitalea]|nr:MULTISPECIES: hypothetical protein [Robiginitalea]MDC6354388.1 hypothetical protein [Robiginitalea sp. PM2]MDC6374930.1 hypothetical protein [Robiginitalea sp. SP8]